MRSLLLLVAVATVALCQTAPTPKAPPKAAVSKPAASTAAGAPAESAFNPETMEKYVRHLNVFDASINVKVGQPVVSTKLPGFKEVTIVASQGAIAIPILYYVSNDGKHIVQGSVYDVAKNPFADNLAKLQTANLPSFGPVDAPVSIVLFSDFQCPVCRDEAKVIRDNVAKAYPTEVRVSFNNFPLEQIHDWSRSAAVAGRCVYRIAPNRFWDFHDAIYEAQDQINKLNLRDKVMEWVSTQKIDVLQFTPCFDNAATTEEVNRDIATGKALNVDRTPTMYINGRPINRGLPWEQLKNLIDFELKYQLAQKKAEQECCVLKLGTP